MTYMVAAYLIIWLVSFALIFSMMQRQRALQQDITMLRNMLNEQETRRS